MPVSSPDLKAFLLATPFFGGLSDASLDLLISMLAERSFDAGATIFAEGEPGRSMLVVHAGDLVVSKLGDSGRSIRMTDLGPGDFFGEMTLIEMQNRSATVVAETATVWYELTARNLYAYYKADIYAYVIVMQNINRELCRRLRRADPKRGPHGFNVTSASVATADMVGLAAKWPGKRLPLRAYDSSEFDAIL